MNADRRPIRVMHVASGDLWAGAEAQVAELVQAMLRQAGMTVSAIVLNEGKLAARLRSFGAEVVVLPESTTSFWRMLRQMVALMKRWRPDIVHTHRQKENVLGALAAHATHVPGCVRTTHGAPEFCYAWWQIDKKVLRAADRWVARRLQQSVFAVSDDLAAQLRFQMPGTAIDVVPNGIDVEAVRAASRPIASLEPTFKHVAFVGRLVPVKRVDLFLHAAAELLADRSARYLFHLIGDGPLADALHELSRDLRISDHCRFHGFQLNVPSLLAAMDCLVLTSDHEGLPMTALEARALGIPVVAHSVGGLKQLLDGARDCRLVASQEPIAIADAIRSAISSDPALRTSGPLLPAQYSITSTAQKYRTSYATLLGDRTLRPES